jgi:hypothetical protein
MAKEFDKNDGVFNFVEAVVEVEGLEKGKDFEVVSTTVMTDDFEVMSIETYAKWFMGKKNLIETSATPFPTDIDDNFVFYKLTEKVDVGLATDLGLGVVRMSTGEYKGEFLIYFPFYGESKEWDDLDEIIALKVYLQLKHPEIYFDKLDKLVDEHGDLVETLIVHNPQKYMKQLDGIFRRHNKKFLN